MLLPQVLPQPLHRQHIRIKRSLIILCALLIVTSVPLSLAISDGDLGIGVVYQNDVHPENLVYELKPGDTFKDEIIVSHTGTQVAHVNLYAEDKPEGDGKTPNKKTFLPQWVKVETPSFDVPPGTTQTHKFTVTVPPDAEKKEYKGSIFVHEPPGENDAPIQVSDGKGSAVITRVGRRIGVGMYLTVTDNPHMPVRTEKDFSLKVDSLQWITLSILGGTIFFGGLLIIQERRRIKSP